MSFVLPLSIVSFAAMWLIFFTAIIFFDDGDDKRTLLLFSCALLALLTVFSLLIPSQMITEYPANAIYAGSPLLNVTQVQNTLSTPEITLYMIFGLFQAFIFVIFAIWSIRNRLQYRTFQQYEREMHKQRRGKLG